MLIVLDEKDRFNVCSLGEPERIILDIEHFQKQLEDWSGGEYVVAVAILDELRKHVEAAY
ncbi:hypothetical protein NDA00_26610 [Funiculus sociatus GB2-M2]|uniref:hypothetical protein n=1 Tax=Funiculus sociatus TaxID=450527 RepID=UPI0032985909